MSQSLHLLFSLGEERYALPTAEVAMVLPLSPCKSLPGAPAWVAGLLPHGSGHVPVIDLSMLALGHPAPARVSTRLVLVHYRHAQALPVLLGLILPQATDTLRLDPAHFTPAAVRSAMRPTTRDEVHPGKTVKIASSRLSLDDSRLSIRPVLVQNAGLHDQGEMFALIAQQRKVL